MRVVTDYPVEGRARDRDAAVGTEDAASLCTSLIFCCHCCVRAGHLLSLNVDAQANIAHCGEDACVEGITASRAQACANRACHERGLC
jgi:hypothetical protein